MTSDKPEMTMIDQAGAVLEMVQKAVLSEQGSKAIVLAAQLEQQLYTILYSELTGLGSEQRQNLFEYPQMLSSFSAKITLCQALGLIPASVAKDLKIIKDVRNKFAHSSKPLTLKSPEVVSKMQPGEGWKAKADQVKYFELLAKRASDGIRSALEKRTANLKERVKTLEKVNQQLAKRAPRPEN